MRAVLLSLILLLATAGGAAAAATVRVDFDPGFMGAGGYDGGGTATVHYDAGAGERNDLTVRFSEAFVRWRIHDAGARVKAGAGCTAEGRHTTVCEAPADAGSFVALFADLGGGADRFRDRSPYAAEQDKALVTVAGGDGADQLEAGASRADLDGGDGRDVVIGGSSPDVLSDGPGRDVVRGGGGGNELRSTDDDDPVADRFYGGSGTDIVSYASRSRNITATVGKLGGERGERDRLVGVESLRGGSRINVLRGDRGDNVLTGGPGPDRLIGGGGSDVLDPGSIGIDAPESGAVDDVRGGAGADTVQLQYRARADVHCGPGDDVAGPFVADRVLLRPDCEQYRAGGFSVRAQPQAVTATDVALQLPCPRPSFERDPSVRLTTPRGAVVAEGSIPYRAGTSSMVELCDVRIPLTQAGQALTRPVAVTARFAFDDGWSFMLRP